VLRRNEKKGGVHNSLRVVTKREKGAVRYVLNTTMEGKRRNEIILSADQNLKTERKKGGYAEENHEDQAHRPH